MEQRPQAAWKPRIKHFPDSAFVGCLWKSATCLHRIDHLYRRIITDAAWLPLPHRESKERERLEEKSGLINTYGQASRSSSRVCKVCGTTNK
ncbi:hypothetical protein PF005_g27460 [Phytophthora fragariae]|uniref:Uncharacterized protein n=1 Tax=Phytophthora fragariae TaxID=53985 RepID=A0A6A3VRA8_9STRA|nr:hypothetical protein PF005_g27460 [Phytophthora fragariae]KAE9175471.1 hypothetical protein PF004_g26371 [Phytophthora fragariae]